MYWVTERREKKTLGGKKNNQVPPPVFLSLIACGLIIAHEQFLIYAVVSILEENSVGG